MSQKEEDIPIKALLGTFPKETLALFATDLVAEKGATPIYEDVTGEILALDLSRHGGFLDVAFKFIWPDGSEAVILLVEHWSDSRSVSERRMNRYVGELLVRHADAVVKAAMLITDPHHAKVDGVFSYNIAGKTILRLEYEVFVTDSQWLDRVRKLRNPVGAVLWVLNSKGSPVERCMEVMALLVDLGLAMDLDLLARLVGVMQKLARMDQAQSRQFLTLLREAPKMTTIVEMLRDEGIAIGEARGEAKGEARGEAKGEAKGKTMGKAEGEARLLRHLVSKGRLTLDEAQSELCQMAEKGEVAPDELELALSILRQSHPL